MLTNMTSNPGPLAASEPLPPPFNGLVADGTLTETQARAVMIALAGQRVPARCGSAGTAGPHVPASPDVWPRSAPISELRSSWPPASSSWRSSGQT